MSVEEDVELKNLVAQALENKGILPQIRAELRANVFLALEENQSTRETLLKNDELSAFAKLPIGSLILNLIRDFLEFFELEFTLSVFDPETKYGKDYTNITKEKMMKDLKIIDCKKKCPVLFEIIERIINSNDTKILNENNQNIMKDFGHGDASGDAVPLIPSPVDLNSTFVKNTTDLDLSPVDQISKNNQKEEAEEEEEEEEEDSIKEESLLNNISSDLGSPEESKLDLSPKIVEPLVVNCNSKELKPPSSPKAVNKNAVEIDLLTFTPVKETKLKEKTKSNTQSENKELKTNTSNKEITKSLSVLGDLPPLNIKAEEKGNKISEIKAIIDKWTDLDNTEELSVYSKSSKEQMNEEKVSAQLKSDRSDLSQNVSQKSGKTETADDFEDDISDLINGHSSSDHQLTVDETISKASCTADYLESL